MIYIVIAHYRVVGGGAPFWFLWNHIIKSRLVLVGYSSNLWKSHTKEQSPGQHFLGSDGSRGLSRIPWSMLLGESIADDASVLREGHRALSFVVPAYLGCAFPLSVH